MSVFLVGVLPSSFGLVYMYTRITLLAEMAQLQKKLAAADHALGMTDNALVTVGNLSCMLTASLCGVSQASYVYAHGL